MTDRQLRPFAMFTDASDQDILRHTSDVTDLVDKLLKPEHKFVFAGLLIAAAYDTYFAIGNDEQTAKILRDGAEILGADTIKEAIARQVRDRMVAGQPFDDEEPFVKFAKNCGFNMWESYSSAKKS